MADKLVIKDLEKPKFKVIVEFEKEFKDNYKKALGQMVGELTITMAKFIK